MKDLEISKELASAVFKLNISEMYIENNNLCFDIDMVLPLTQSINIYEFAFKCKEWAYSKCHEIISYTEGSEMYQTQLGYIIKDFVADSEVEAIIKACEWLLKEGL